jgi:pimeloyl-ACP methyl ester carboxylesterase
VNRRPREFVVEDGDGRTVTLRAVEWGSPRAHRIVLLHGGGANAEWWSHVAPRLTGAGAVLALDLRGHGESDATPGRYGLGIFASDVTSIVDRLGESVSLVGASMGGLVAMLVAARSDRIDRLVVVDSPLEPPADGNERRKRLGTPKRYATRDEAISRFRLIPPATNADPALIRRIAEHSVRRSADGTWTLKFDSSVFSAARKQGAEAVGPRIRVPLLYVRGERSEIVSEESARRLVQSIPGSRVETIPGAHHHLFLDDPEAFLALVLPFLAERNGSERGQRTDIRIDEM